MIKNWKLLSLLLALPLLVSLFISSSASAVDGSTTINITENWNTYLDSQWHYNISDGAVTIPHNLLNQNATYTKALSWFRYRTLFPDTENYLGDSRNMYNVVTIRFQNINNSASGGQWTNLNLDTFSPYINYTLSDGTSGSSSCNYTPQSTVLNIDCSIRTREYTQVTGFDFRTGASSSSTDIISTLNRGNQGAAVILTRIGVSWTGTSDPSLDYLDEINANILALNSLLGDVKSTLNITNNYIQNNTQSINNLNQTMEDANDDAQSRWEADKQEEAEREQQGKDDSDEVLSIFNFNFSNPFAPILDMFSSNQCVNIPTIAQWIHSPTSQYCSWWSQPVRQVATPIFGLGSSMLLFGFIVRWLKQKNGVEVE